MKYNTHTLANGLRVIHLPSASPVLYCGYQINAGTRDEDRGDEGLAHFCEHATFKGTSHRRGSHVASYLETVGGDINAFTVKEATVYHAAVLRDHAERAVDLLSDIVFRSTYPSAELQKEVEVICDEIESYNDTPSELIFDEFENIIFSGHPLGHNILGTSERVRSYGHDDALRFVNRYYLPQNAVFFAYGDVDFQRLLRWLEKYTRDVPDEREGFVERPQVPLPNAPLGATIVRERGTHQAHVVMGTRAYSVDDPRRMTLYLLNNIIGGPAMNSRLNVALREKSGLVYTVESLMTCYGDTGLWAVYFGCDARDVDRCLRLTRRKLDEMAENQLSEGQISRAKRQLKGQIGVACDNRESFALDFGRSYLHFGRERDIATIFAQIDAVTPRQLQEVAQEVFLPSAITTLVYR